MSWRGAKLLRACVGTVLLLGACATYHPQPLDPSPGLASSLGQLQLQVKGGGHPELPQAWRDRTVNADDDLDEVEISLLVVLNSPNLRAARMQMGEARARLIKAGLLPDPQFSTSFDFPTSKDSSLMTGYSFGLGFDLQSLITRGARRSAATQRARATWFHVLWQEWQVIQQARMLYRRTLIQRRQMEVMRDQYLQSRHTWEGRKTALSQGDGTLDQEGLALAPMMSARAAWMEARRQYNATVHGLTRLIGVAPTVPLPLSMPPGGLESLLARPSKGHVLRRMLSSIGKRRPDLLALRTGYEAQEASVRQQILAQFPSFTIGANRLRDTGGVWTLGPFVNLNLPLLNGNRGNIAVARATRGRLRAEYHEQLTSAYVQASQLAKDQSLAFDEWRALVSRLPTLEVTVKRMANALRAGEIDMLTFTTLRNAYFSQQIRSLTLEQALLEQTIALDTLTGTLLPGSVRRAPRNP
ncbi:MAG: TolC family protein [Mariprofundaceae bacterium]|nr:TolC family protein [Mariprofundaceae bacterium]